MNTILIMIATTAIFFIGIVVGYNLKENKKIINIPKKNNIKKIISSTEENKKEDDEKELENQKEIIRLNKIMSNVDNYNGRKEGQVEID